MHILDSSDLHVLFETLISRGYTLVGPTVRSEAIVYDQINTVDDLPRGLRDEQSPAHYALKRVDDDLYFGFVVGPQSWKKYLYPPRLTLFSASKSGKGFTVSTSAAESPARKLAFFGVRPCELAAIAVQDRVFTSGEYVDPTYKMMRESVFIVAVNCTISGGNCFCASMGTGPEARSGFDIVLTEMNQAGRHYFTVASGSERGESLLNVLPGAKAGAEQEKAAGETLRMAASSQLKRMASDVAPQLLKDNFEHPRWDDVAKRCLACTNCTMVCPTCFCSTVEDSTDLSGTRADRTRRWDSCFTMDFTKVAGGNIRPSTRARYRQWLTHKLSNWVDQFGTSGCVGCGRCITWCPAGIDITAEVDAIRGTGPQEQGVAHAS